MSELQIKNRSVNRRMEYILSLLSVFVAAQVTSQLRRSLSPRASLIHTHVDICEVQLFSRNLYK